MIIITHILVVFSNAQLQCQNRSSSNIHPIVLQYGGRNSPARPIKFFSLALAYRYCWALDAGCKCPTHSLLSLQLVWSGHWREVVRGFGVERARPDNIPSFSLLGSRGQHLPPLDYPGYIISLV